MFPMICGTSDKSLCAVVAVNSSSRDLTCHRGKKTNTRFSPRCEHQCWLGLVLPTRSPTQLHSAGWDWFYPPDPQLSCTCGPPVADAQADSYTSSLAAPGCAEDGRFTRGPLRLRQDSTMLKGNFPAQTLKVCLWGSESLLEDSFTH